jgi:hypothetical protein
MDAIWFLVGTVVIILGFVALTDFFARRRNNVDDE